MRTTAVELDSEGTEGHTRAGELTSEHEPVRGRAASGTTTSVTFPGDQQGTRTPVFADPSGKRWRRSKVAFAGIGAAALVTTSALVFHHSQPTHEPVVDELTVEAVGENPPVIGEGPSVQIVRIDRSGGTPIGINPSTGTPVGELTAADLAEIGDSEYAIRRFGYAEGTTKTISLTFDDGPHPVWTPKLLDLLSAEGVPATFFVTGENIAKHPQFVERAAREGHAVAGHSVTHTDVSQAADWRAAFELMIPDRELRSTTSTATGYMRLPYIGATDQSLADEVEGLIQAQNHGYTMVGQDFDPRDWYYADHPEAGEMPMPQLDGQNVTVLLHDAGGSNRDATLEYVDELIDYAKAEGYTFTTVPQAQPEIAQEVQTVEPTVWDDAALTMSKVTFAWPGSAMSFLFWFAAVSVVGLGILYVVLASLGRRRRSRTEYPTDDPISVSVVLAAYNEEKVIGRTIESLLGSTYPLMELIVVDDGSSDGTAGVVSEWAAHDPRVRLVSQANAGKSAAMNKGFRIARGEAVFSMDADTIVTPDTLGQLARHMALDEGGQLAGVGCVVRVGNRRTNLLTRWQALEYVSQIGLERAAQDYLHAVVIVPGACALWRREPVLRAGGFSHDTLAEDCDLTLALQRDGYTVTLDYEALAYTEAPETVDALLAQRTRWSFGTIQALFKHRHMLFRREHGWLGMFVLPWQLAQIVIPLVTIPLVWLSMIMVVLNGGLGLLASFFLAFTLLHLILAAFSVGYVKEKPSLLLMVPIYRLVFDPLRAYLLYVSAFRALRGVVAGWNKLQRTGSMDEAAISEMAPTRSAQPTAAAAALALA